MTHWSVFESGGHFAAMEKPAELAADLRAFFRTVRARRSDYRQASG